MTIDRDVWEYEAKPGYKILGVDFESNMTNLPETSNATTLIPVHCYLETNHFVNRGAVTQRPSNQSGKHRVKSDYFHNAGSTGYNSSTTNTEGVWHDRKIELFPSYNIMEGAAEEDDGSLTTLGSAEGVTQNEIVHLDVMTEVQWENSFDLPQVDPNDNKTIINFVLTQNGWKRPGDVLKLRGHSTHYRANPYSICNMATDSWNRFWFYHGIDPTP